MRRFIVSAVLAASLAGCQPAGKGPDTASAPRVERLDSDRARASYMVGLDLARNLEPIRDEVDLAIVEQAVRDRLAGRPSLLDAQALEHTRTQFSTHLREQREARQRALAADNLRAGDAFLEKNAGKPGVRRTSSGLQYLVLKPGTGAHPKAGDTVRVNYAGTLLDGREFENTWKVDHAAEFPLGQVMPGLREAITLMAVGSRHRVWIPSKLAYAEAGVPGAIEPQSTLVFEIELLEVAQGPAAPEQPGR
ncbi:FKBP-type peptidyl-prolyl cis-trans isomerase [Agrilutibacter solisilvae]|uniref:Peptidyl-prolyl cis-trans isomerase n=1 Tax=Agrilutibacter solisilvae TaxID=2763317 RepID=A0A974Y0C4_9GAMM|nr:FKBP-type peptidyl-prolyl cis-trans isomerase [Lysobacter solisilvae]QSX79086.1 FKBP-type peptidyl-prolyl cis-trans isomerase [Lysobacter solisilvae]